MGKFERYRLASQIGQGGFAEVFEAAEVNDPHTVVALKRPLGVPFAAERLRREIDVQSRITHPNVMPILDADASGTWFTMPLAEGSLETLGMKGAIDKRDPKTVEDVIRAVIKGLAAAHLLGFVHRDVTPRNILALPDATTPSGRRWVVADWGLVRRPLGETTARLTRVGEGMGTWGFAAPECWVDAHQVDHRADVYSVGRIAAWMLTGRDPVANVQLLPDGPWRGWVAESTRDDPARRLETMTSLESRLDTLLAAPPSSPRSQLSELFQGSGDDVPAEAWRIALDHCDDEQLFIDHLARAPLAPLETWATEFPEDSARLALQMCRHMATAEWRGRSFDYANTPLRWIFVVMQSLVRAERLDLLEDIASEFFVVESSWDRWEQLDRTRVWLRSASGEVGRVLARAIRRADAQGYYAMALRGERLVSVALSDELEL